MCGIVGYWRRKGPAEALAAALPQATAALAHRGPDGRGTWLSEGPAGGVGFGHTRLAILDLTAAAAQPMHAHDAEIVIVFNGEIYNFREIAAELRARGHVLRGDGDTEVVLEAFRAWGPACVDRFIGMFAFAIWDGAARQLWLCRDRIGVKPLYVGWDGTTLCFASELKALRALPCLAPEIDAEALGEFLQYGYIAGDRCIYRGVRKLAPGSWLRLDAEGPPQITPYWRLRDAVAKGPLAGDPAALEEALEALLMDAFKQRLVSDVPVGLFLSGGVDSSLVAGLLRAQGVRLETFTIGFTSAAHDESAAAAAVAHALDLPNTAMIVDQAEAEAVFARWPDLYDEPFGDHSGIPTFLVAQMARRRVSVALSADGGDELFCGYAGYLEMAQRMQAQARLPGAARWAAGAASGAAERLAAGLGHGLALDRAAKMRGFLDAAPGLDALRPFRTFWQAGEVGRLLGGAYRDPRRASLAWPGAPMEQIAALDFHEYLPDDVLAKTDRATMAAGLEGREPLLDHRVVEMAFRLPLAMRHGPLGAKHALRSILYRHVPRALVDRPKQGFAVPISDWMGRFIADGALAGSFEALAGKLGLERKALDAALAAFAGSPQGRNRLWLLHVLGGWAARWL